MNSQGDSSLLEVRQMSKTAFWNFLSGSTFLPTHVLVSRNVNSLPNTSKLYDTGSNIILLRMVCTNQMKSFSNHFSYSQIFDEQWLLYCLAKGLSCSWLLESIYGKMSQNPIIINTIIIFSSIRQLLVIQILQHCFADVDIISQTTQKSCTNVLITSVHINNTHINLLLNKFVQSIY